MTAVSRGGMWASIGSTAAAKIVVLGLSGILGIITSRLIIQTFGTEVYAQYGLLTAFPALLPFADLGIAAVVINAVAASDSVRTDDYVRRAIVTAFRILLVSGGIIVAVALTITLVGLWPTLLGDALLADGGSIAAFACLATFGLVLPLTVGQRILVGLRRTTAQVASQSVVAPFIFVSVLLIVVLAVPAGSYLAVLSYVAAALVSIIGLGMAARAISPQLGRVLREIPHPRRYPGVPAIGLAWPMLVQMIALPIAMQSSRVQLSHLSTVDELAQYNLAAQLFGIVLQTIAAAGIALWPIYAKARAAASIQSPFAPTLWFLGGGLALGIVLAALSPWVAGFVSDGAIALDPWLLGGFVVFVGLQAAKYPIGMYMTDRRGLVFQVVPVVAMVPIALGLSWVLILQIGAGGAVIGTAVAVLTCQVIPNLWYVARDLRQRRAAEFTDPDPGDPGPGDPDPGDPGDGRRFDDGNPAS